MTCVGAPTGTALRSLKDAGLENVPVITNFGNLVHAQLGQYAPFVPDQLYLTAPRFVTYDVSSKGPVRDAQRTFYEALERKESSPTRPIVCRGIPHSFSSKPCAGLERVRPRKISTITSKRSTATPERSAFSIFATAANAASG